MSAAPFVFEILGFRTNGAPNFADGSSETSIAIAKSVLHQLDISQTLATSPQESGRLLEECVEEAITHALNNRRPEVPWTVSRRSLISEFEQYEHLAKLEQLIDNDTSHVLSVELGRDYLVRPDVTVGILQGDAVPYLHATISCKWTIRSDRVQNIRHEGVVLTRHRRGRQPHIVTVTAEPLPTRLAAIARRTGEVDAVYHLFLDELITATENLGAVEQIRTLNELISQTRLKPYNALAATLAF